MSSPEGDLNSSPLLENKKRRIQRACDTCRRRKIRCDGSQTTNSRNRCSNCAASNFECTYDEATRKHPPTIRYVEGLESRLAKMEKLFRKHCPDVDLSRELDGGLMEQGSQAGQRARTGASGSGHVATINATSPYHTTTNVDDLASSDDEDGIGLKLSERFSSLSLNPLETSFFGKSSGIKFIQKAINLKKEMTGSEPLPHFFGPQEGHPCPWEMSASTVEEPEYIFPEEDLGMALVDHYFTQINFLLPLLHRPSFERKIQQGVHLHNSMFGTIYLLVCSVGSRFSNDPRVFLDDVEPNHREKTAGWKYFKQVQMVRRTLLSTPCLEDLQLCSLATWFLQGTSAPHACWTIVGIGIRLAQEVGAHRRKSYNDKPSIEGELWKRAFWVLVMLDRQLSTSLGRSCAIQTEDFDIDFPIECDDEYWEHPDPEQAFKQPPGKPSTVCYFTHSLKLNNIVSFAARTIYSINKSKILLGFIGQQWEQHIVAELDSSLNKWIDEVPDHLRWDPDRDVTSLFFIQSTALYAGYYIIQIFVHRPFIPSPRKPSPLSFPSLAICTNAARSCSHIIDTYRKRSGDSSFFLAMPAFTSGVVLLMNIWGGKRSGLSIDPLKEMADVHKCMAILRQCKNRWHTAERLWGLLYELASVGDLPLPQPSPQGAKRERDSDSPIVASYPSFNTGEAAQTSSGSHTELHSHPQQSQPSIPRTTEPQMHSLPVHSNDLGRLPVHGQMNFPMKGSTFPTMSSSSASAAIDLSNTWSPPLSDATSLHRSSPSPHTFPSPNTFSFDNLFNDKISAQFGGYSIAHALTGPGSLHPPSLPQDDLQAFLHATVVANDTQASTMPELNGMLGLDMDTMSMWSCAPSAFEVNDWGAYLSNVVQQPGPGGPSTSTF